jgi:hypothetical protein
VSVTNTVSGAPETPVAAETQPDPKAEAAALRAELDGVKARLTDQERAAEFWYQKSLSGAAAPPEPKAAEPEPEEDVDVLDVLTTKGAKGLDEILARRGYVRADEVDARVNSRAAQFATENELLQSYPDLRDQKSEFFRSTAAHYGELKSQGVPEALAMRIAAERAELDGIKTGKVKTPQQIQTDERARKEANRIARINAQSGDRRPRAAEPEDEADDEMTDHEKRICDAMGVSYEAYQKRARQGVQMSLRGLSRDGRSERRG